jgi:purine-binding chemotaxis protein CheW
MFTLDDAEYGIEILNVREIIRMTQITPVKNVPPHIRGVINLRGKVIPVTDLRIRLGLKSAEYTNRTCIIIIESKDEKNTLTGIIVDAVRDVRGIKGRDIRSPQTLDLKTDEMIHGLAKFENDIKIIINPTSDYTDNHAPIN